MQIQSLTNGEAPHARFYSADNEPPRIPPAVRYDRSTRPMVADAVAAERVLRVRRGVYVEPSPMDRPFDAEFLAQVRGVVEALSTEYWVSHTAAARLHGLWTFRDPGKVHVTQERNPCVKEEGRLERHWTRALPARDKTVLGDVPVTTLERTIVDVACSAPLPCAVVTATSGFRAGAVPAVVERILDERAGGRGVVQARRVMELCDPDCAAPGEALVRLAAIEGALPLPQVQVPVAIPTGTAWLDVGWPVIKAGLEFDGAVKFSGAFGNPAAARDHQAVRAAGLEQAGWSVESVVWAESLDFQALQEQVQGFYRRAVARSARAETRRRGVVVSAGT
ncbi:Transcriptional regulator, AbiEi antitoxin, Type IV TA system [Promicromonospora thailandica]|uniref:Transcriptional regulator, AbiEi antitoxin, Type IV TA system n=1 Tax=Promicromonospora thailandica TaxID=765201 RepID=A0A9X2G3X6_9MICO|nr:Transcriptional regulator, AbiEi antitoxin, Type IV TA system [Promicromonospora thailandica]